MPDSEKDAERWDSGCRSDDVRNKFVIPELIRLFNQARPQHILDIGAGTGHIARKVDQSLDYRPTWTLLDPDITRLEFSEKLRPRDMVCEIVACRLEQASDEKRYDAAILAFTLLEMSDVSSCMDTAFGLLNIGGYLIIFVPDVWLDVLSVSLFENNILEKFLHGSVELTKGNPFTGGSYPFKTVRFERLISEALSSGFVLTGLERGSVGKGIYALHLRKLDL